VGSFTLNGKKASSNKLKVGPSSTPSSQFAAPGVISQGPSFGSSSGIENGPFSQGSGIYNNTSQLIPTISMYQKLLAHDAQP
jgi:hypothetical protein